MQHSLAITTLGGYAVGQRVNVERAAKEGAEVGGHILSGHVDGTAQLLDIAPTETNYKIRLPAPALAPYVFAKGYIAINGASLTVAEADRQAGWFDVWLIPETRRATVFEDKRVGDAVNIEIERSTQVMVDTVRETVAASLAAAPRAGSAAGRKRAEAGRFHGCSTGTSVKHEIRATRNSCKLRRMKNLTITVEDSVLDWARIEAARRGTSVSRMVGDFMAEMQQREDAYERAYLAWRTDERTWRGAPPASCTIGSA